jgi:hypothetical protein
VGYKYGNEKKTLGTPWKWTSYDDQKEYPDGGELEML